MIPPGRQSQYLNIIHVHFILKSFIAALGKSFINENSLRFVIHLWLNVDETIFLYFSFKNIPLMKNI